MSSSNLVRVTFLEETTLGTTPGAGNFTTARFTNEKLSASPTTASSQQIRTDRMSSGQVVTGLEVKGDLSFELAKESSIEQLMAGAMLNAWDVLASVTVDMTIDATAKTITRASGNFHTGLVVGDILTLSAFATSANNTQVQIVEFISNTVVRVVSNGTLVDETGSGTSYKRADKLTIGGTKKSFTVEKAFTDLTTKALIYRGKVVEKMDLNVAYGSIITGSFGFSGTKYDVADSAVEFVTNGRTITPAATTLSMNGSVDMPFLNSDILGTLDEVNFCIQSLSLSLTNNYQAQTCIGLAAPKDYSPGTAAIEISMSTYLSDVNWDVIGKKLTQDPFALGFMLKNTDGWYGFYIPAIQVSFDDPSSGGQNQQISLDMKGTAKVAADGSSALVIYRS